MLNRAVNKKTAHFYKSNLGSHDKLIGGYYWVWVFKYANLAKSIFSVTKYVREGGRKQNILVTFLGCCLK